MRNKIVYVWLNAGIPFYIGIGCPRRAYVYKGRNSYSTNKRLKAEREGTFEVRILHKNLSWQQACEIEISLISLYGRVDNGTGLLTNMTDGGEGTINRHTTDEARRNYSIANSGKNNPRYGIPSSRETKEKQSASLKGKTHTEESKKKISENKRGVKNPKSVPVHTDRGIFESYGEASRSINCSPSTIMNRIRSDKFPEYYLL